MIGLINLMKRWQTGTVRYICGSLTPKGKKWQIFQVLLDEHEQILTSFSDFVTSASCIADT